MAGNIRYHPQAQAAQLPYLTDGIRAEVLSGLGDEQKIRKQTGDN